MRDVKIRHETLPGSYIYHRETNSTYEYAESICGFRLDRRKNYMIIKGEVCEAINWSDECSGCSYSDGYNKEYRGQGCHECGYQGRVRFRMWNPIF